MPRISFQPLGDSWALVLFLLAALVVGLICLASNDPSVSKFRRRAELGLRLAFVPLFAILFVRPAQVSVEKEELPASVVFLCDLSESMDIRDVDGASRFEALKKTFAGADEKFKTICEKFNARVVGFSDATEELNVENGSIVFPERPTGHESKLGDALLETLRSTSGKRLLAIVALSDGSQRANDPSALAVNDAALRLRDADLPVYSVPLGSTDAAATIRDVAVQDLRANDHVFLGNELTVSGQVRLLGLAGQSIPLTLALETESGEMQVVDQTTLEPQTNDETLPYQFSCKPDKPGEWKFTVAAPTQEFELTDSNNALSDFAQALDRGTDALYIEGTRRFEQNFIRAALDSTSDVRIKYWRPSIASLVGKSPNHTEAEMVAEYAKKRKSLEKAFFSDGKYATYVLGDVDSTAFQKNELAALAELVRNGAGLVVLAGERSLSLGGYADTPLADVLPVTTYSSDRVPLDSDLNAMDEEASDEQRLRFEGRFQVEAVSGKGVDDYVARLSLDAKKNAEIWKNMPPISTLYSIGRLKPNATILLTARELDESGRSNAKSPVRPLLVAHQYGLGRVVVLATDSTWRWRMRGKEEEHAKFWRQLLLWTAKFDELLEGELAVELDQARIAPNEQLDFHAAYKPKPGEDVEQMFLEASIVGPDGVRESVELTEEQGIWRGVGRKTDAPGDYMVEATLRSASGETLQTAKSRFLVYSRNLELERPEANPETLERLAKTTNGQTVQASEFNALLDDLLQRRETIADYREVKRTLYDTWLVFSLFVALAAADWILRKRWGMV